MKTLHFLGRVVDQILPTGIKYCLASTEWNFRDLIEKIMLETIAQYQYPL